MDARPLGPADDEGHDRPRRRRRARAHVGASPQRGAPRSADDGVPLRLEADVPHDADQVRHRRAARALPADWPVAVH